MTAGALTPDESRLIDGLTASGISRSTAALAIVLLVRRNVRPESELLDLLANYPWLDDAASRQQALDDARGRQWVVEIASQEGGPVLIRAAPDLATRLAAQAPALAPQLERAVQTDLRLSVLGHMGETTVYDTFRTRLGQARSDICLPMVMTTNQLAVVETLKERADSGAKVRIMIASADLAGRIRGANMVATAKSRLKAWREHSKGHRNLQVRVTRHRIDLRDASSMLVDGVLLRYDVYDDESQRSTDGVMLELFSDRPTNLSRMFQDRFDDAWARARPLGFWRSAGWVVRRWWWVVVAAVLLGVVVWLNNSHPVIASLILGAVVGYLVNHVDPITARVKQIWERMRT